MSLVWKSERPRVPGWYWVREQDGAARIVEIVQIGSQLWRVNREDATRSTDLTMYAQFAGPIALPVEPSRESLAAVRYRLGGDYLVREGGMRPGYWEGEWCFASRAEMLRRAKVCLCGDAHYYTTPVEADSSRIQLYTNRRVNGRWARRWIREDFTAETIDAAIAAEANKGAAFATA